MADPQPGPDPEVSQENITLPLLGAGAADELPISPATGLAIVQGVWAAGSRMKKLAEKYKGKEIPPGEMLAALTGLGDNPLAEIERQLAEISSKLDRVLQGIDEIKKQLDELQVLTIFNSMKKAVDYIDLYFEQFPDMVARPRSDVERQNFIKQLLGKISVRDSARAFALEVINLDQTKTHAQLFEKLFPLYLKGATKWDARDRYMTAAFMFRWVTDALVKAMLLELFTVAESGKEPAGIESESAKVLKQYRDWFRLLLDRHLLPLAEQLATLRFIDEYQGGNLQDGYVNDTVLFQRWTAPESSLLQSADQLAAQLMGYERSVTLRVIPQIPPVKNELLAPDKRLPRISSGYFFWQFIDKTKTSLTKETLLTQLLEKLKDPKNFWTLGCWVKFQSSESVAKKGDFMRVDIQFLPGATIPLGYTNQLSFLRIQYDLSETMRNKRGPFYFSYESKDYPLLVSEWRFVFRVDNRYETKYMTSFNQKLVADGFFDLPAEGFMSPTLVTYAYEVFGQRPR